MPSRLRAALTVPGPWVFAILTALEGMARASLAALLPLVALDIVGSARNVSAVFSAVGWAGLAATFTIPWLVRRFRAGAVYALGGVLVVLATPLYWAGSAETLVLGLLFRVFAMACLNVGISLFIMATIPKRMLSRSEPLRTFCAAFAWSFGPWLGVTMHESAWPAAAFAFSAAVGLLFLAYFLALRIPSPTGGGEAKGSPWRNMRRFCAQPRLVLAWLLNFGREWWWVCFFIYTPIFMVQAGESESTGAMVVSFGTAFLFVTPLMAWFGRRFGLRRVFVTCFTIAGAATVATGVWFEHHWWAAGLQLAAALCAVTLDSVGYIPFMRAVRARERPEMTMVFGTYRDLAGLLPTALFTALLTFFDLSAAFLATGVALFAFAALSRFIPRGM
jgi:drug/metabolite transporter (DMT)-like permease